MAVAFDAATASVTTVLDHSDAAKTLSPALTLGAITNTGVVVVVLLEQAADGTHTYTGETLTVAGASATRIGAIDNAGGGRIELWGIIGVSASTTPAIVWTPPAGTYFGNFYGFATSWGGVLQTGGATSFAHFNSTTTTGANPSLAITSATGNATVAAFMNEGSSAITATNNTTLYSSVGPFTVNMAANRAAGAASVTMSATAGSETWLGLGVDVVAAGGVTHRSCRGLGSMMGVGCGIWAAKKIEENPIITRRRLLLPR